MWTIHLRWRAIFEPICWILGHIPVFVPAWHALDREFWECGRCAKNRPAGRMRRVSIPDSAPEYEEYPVVVWESLGWDGTVIAVDPRAWSMRGLYVERPVS